MKKYGLIVFLMLMGSGLVLGEKVRALDPTPNNKVIFSEVFLGNPSPNAGQEFIEIYNTTPDDINLMGWRLQYTSASKNDWNSPSRNITLSGSIKAGEYYLVTSTGYLTDKANLTYSSTLSQGGGHLRIIDQHSDLQDQIGWGNAAMPLGVASEAPEPGSSLARLTNSAGYNLSLDNNTDFVSSLSPTPGTDNVITIPAVEEETVGPGPSTLPIPSTSPPVVTLYDDIQISEILPNPVAPATDANDEFIELYNPNQKDVDLNGYVIKTGVNGTYKYVIKNQIIAAGGYRVFYSRDTHLILSNTTGKVQLLAPDGSLLDETNTYSKAEDGQVLIFSSGSWVWSSSASVGADNIYTPVAVVKAASTTKKAAAKTAKAKAPKKAPTKKKKAEKATVPLASATSTPPTSTIHPLILATVGTSALLYALYEYRNDLGSTLYRLRRYRDTRGGFWSAVAATANDRVNFRSRRWQNDFRTWIGARFRQ